MRRHISFIVGLVLVTVLSQQSALAGAPSPSVWYSGMRAFGNATVEPAVDLATGDEIFLLTPNNVPTPAGSNDRAHAPLYLTLYPASSTIPASTFNCQPTNCNHAQTFPGYALKGHDHLVGVPHTGDFNVAWDVYPVFFTAQGLANHAYNTRITTLTQLLAARDAGNVFIVPTEVFAFNCSITAAVTYTKATPLTFTP